MIRWITIVLSIVGLAIGVWAVSTADEPPVELPLARPASVNPFEKGVAALGVVEPAGRDVGVVAPETELVARVLVEVGQRVSKSEPLFELDTRELQAELVRARAAVDAAQSEIDRWHALPRKEDIPPLEAALQRAQAVLMDRDDVLRITQEAAKRGSSNDREIAAAQFAAEAARADAARAKADLDRMNAGGWVPDLKVAESQLAQRRAEVDALTILLDRLTVRAPRDGVVLRRDIEEGEFASTDRRAPALILGDLEHLAVRAQVDEEDISLVTPSSKAVGRTRGAAPVEISLKLIRIEPYARPKRDLTGDNAERVDTRVIDVVFDVAQNPRLPIYPGQAVDVFIQAADQ
ncbi:Multidrug resistance protein MdtN [Phycisphaerales bacterium]|nr:Multidrug resistance protein MdtN [Phycisphaerales bacterium]